MTTPPAPVPADTIIVLPSMSYSAGVLSAVPYARYLGERSLSELATLRDPGASATLVSADEIDPWVIDRTLADLSAGDESRQVDMRRRLCCLVPAENGDASLARRVLADADVMARLHAAVRRARSALLVNFAPSASTDEVAQRLGIAVEEGPAGLAEHWGTKSGSKELFYESGVLCPRGQLEVVSSVGGVTRLARRLADADPPAERVMVKLDASGWASGIGNAVVRSATLRRSEDLGLSVDRLLQPWGDYVRALEDGGAIVEEYVAGASAWPSAQGHVRRAGGFELLAVHDQILVDGEYLGCTFPVAADVAREVGDAMGRIAATLERRDFHGSLGVDFIVAEGRIYAMEVNLRKIGPSHVIKAVCAQLEPESSDRTRGVCGIPIAYVHRRLYEPDLLTGLTARRAFAVLEREGLAFDRREQTGTLLHVAGALHPAGFVETTSIAKTLRQAHDLHARAVAALRSAARAARGDGESAG